MKPPEIIECHKDAVSEFHKLKDRLALTKEEQDYLNKIQNKKIQFKRCNKCGAVLPTTEFYKNPLKKMGVFDYCKACACLMALQRRKLKKEREERERRAFQIMMRSYKTS